MSAQPGRGGASDAGEGVPGAAGSALPPLRLATRTSALAMAQSTLVGEQLCAATGRRLELVEVTTRGDVDRAPLAQIGGTGVFVAAVREALAEGRADVAVHSLKDLPTAADPRLVLAAVPPRVDPRDALVAHGAAAVADLPVGARVGTGSPRRRAQLAAARPDLELVELRGNVDTRIGRVDGDDARGVPADLDAVVLAAAGMRRLGRATRISALIDPALMLPAPGQGALAVEARADLEAHDPQGGAALAAALAALDDPVTRAAVTAERMLLATLEAGCSAPVGALAERVPGAAALHLRGLVAAPDGTLHRAEATGPLTEPEALGRAVAERLLALLDAVGAPRPGESPRSATPHQDPAADGAGGPPAMPGTASPSSAPSGPGTTSGPRTTGTTSGPRETGTTSTTSPRPTTHRGSPPR